MVYRDVEKKLRRSGWLVVRSKGSHRQFQHPDKPGCVVTVPDHGNKDLSVKVLENIEKGTGLSLRR